MISIVLRGYAIIGFIARNDWGFSGFHLFNIPRVGYVPI